MLTVTEAATRKIGEIMSQQSEPVFGLRVSFEGGGCGCHPYSLSFSPGAVAGDWIGEFGGVKVLVDPTSAPELEGVSIDYVESLQGSGFTVTHPNPKPRGGGGGGCGCGCGNGHGGEETGEAR